MNQKKNIVICIPSGRYVEFAFFKSFANNIGSLMHQYNTAVLTVASPMIFENRNELLRRAFQLEESTPNFLIDYIVWIDNDIVFTFEQVKKLIEHLDSGKGFVSGVYYNPTDKGILPVAYKQNGEKYSWLRNEDLKGLIEVDAVGFGFCAFRMDFARKLFEKFKPRPFDLRPLQDGSLVTEDQVFCERLKEIGVKIFLDSDLVVKHSKGVLPH
ncbi:MAG TPA: glycosyltransferase [archaeon]|nr:glycosyltransferase [archaeon]